MGKELEALENIRREAGIPYFSALYDIDMWREDFATIENALIELEVKREIICDILTREEEEKYEALEIIKEKEVVISILIRSNTLGEYNNNPMFVSKLLIQEEYDLLKKVLC